MATTRDPSHCEPAAASHGVAVCTQGRPKPKLRNSCYACSVSKLKCPQEKPTCSRCAKRSLKCEYFAAKPAGRKPNKALGIGQARRRHAGSAPDGATEMSHANEADPFAKDASAAPAHLHLQHDAWFHPPSCADPQDSAGNALRLPDVLLPPQPLSPRPTGMAIDLDMPLSMGHRVSSSSASSTINRHINLSDCFSTPMSSTTDKPDFDLIGTAAILFAAEDSCSDATDKSGNVCDSGRSHKDLGSLPFDTGFTPFLDSSALSELFTVVTSDLTHQGSLSSPSLELQHDHAHLTPAPHSCFARALRVLERMSSESYPRNPSAPLTAAAIIAENEAVMEDVGSMLDCSCSEDVYLLYIAALIMSKALDSYSRIVRQRTSPTLSEGPGRLSACGTGSDYVSVSSSPGARSILEDKIFGRKDHVRQGVESARMTAQLVLSELYLVRRLVGKLSSKLKWRVAGDEADLIAGGVGLKNSSLAGKTASPCLLTMGDHLVEALSGRLKALSFDISQLLRAA